MIKISKSIAIICFIFINVLFAKNLDSIEKVSLQLHWKYQFQFAGFIAAKEKGFYKDQPYKFDSKNVKI
ncbi:MAG: hypothetical protein U9R39_08735 [Campylobacterota bacterium]|nr:hypothetical protein [Campylobacterota bacterium]